MVAMTPDRWAAWLDASERAFLLTLGAGIVDTLLLIWGYIDQSSYTFLTNITVGAYIGRSLVQGVMEARRGPTPPSAPDPR